ncbi:MAG: glycine cleavage system protein GcvH [Parachlamydiaceae bacterium]|nr:glycine cleavage system protein GcvH [Parachlamydiaceae bacterium]
MKFTDSHEWIEWETDQIAKVGITTFAQKELGDIVFVELPNINQNVNAKQEVAVLESTKAAADIYSPVSGEIVEVNILLQKTPELINQSPEKQGWLYKIRLSNPSELDLLMDHQAYAAMLNGA